MFWGNLSLNNLFGQNGVLKLNTSYKKNYDNTFLKIFLQKYIPFGVLWTKKYPSKTSLNTRTRVTPAPNVQVWP